jgi:hypothetical protein
LSSKFAKNWISGFSSFTPSLKGAKKISTLSH